MQRVLNFTGINAREHFVKGFSVHTTKNGLIEAMIGSPNVFAIFSARPFILILAERTNFRDQQVSTGPCP